MFGPPIFVLISSTGFNDTNCTGVLLTILTVDPTRNSLISPNVLVHNVLIGLRGLIAAPRSSSPFSAVFGGSTIGSDSSYVPDLRLIVVYAP